MGEFSIQCNDMIKNKVESAFVIQIAEKFRKAQRR